jgi:hypothetical protein
MKFSKTVLFLGCAGLGLTLAYSQQSNSAAQQKALDALHQTLAGQGTSAPAPAAAPAAPREAAPLPSRDQLLADVERLHNEGRISDQQYATFKKNIQEQYANAAAPTQSQALAQKALAQKIQQLKTGMTAPVPATVRPAAPAPVAPAVAAAPAKTQAQPKPAPQPAPVAAQSPAPAPKPAPVAVAAPVVVAAPAKTSQTPQRTNTVPASTYSTLSPQQEAQAREILRQKIAETNSQVPPPKAAPAPVVTATPRPTPKPAPTATAIAAGAAAQPVSPAPVVVAAPMTAATTPAPPSSPLSQAKAVEAYRDYYIIGIPPGTPELVRILRVKVAELNGVITPVDVQSIRLASRFYGPSPWAVAAIDPKTEIPFPTKNPEGLVQLNQLNTLYRSNLISPGDYHQQRAKIVASL